MPPAASGSSEAARRLFAAGRPLPGTPAEAYLRARGITGRLDWPALRYHPSIYYRETDHASLESWPALLAAVTDIRRQYHRHPAHLARSTAADQGAARRSAPCPRSSARQRRTLRHGRGGPRRRRRRRDDARTQISAALTADDRRALGQPPRRARSAPCPVPPLCRARQRRRPVSGRRKRLHERGRAAGIDVRELVPVHGDFNLDLCRLGPEGCSRISSISSSPPTWRDFCPILAVDPRR